MAPNSIASPESNGPHGAGAASSSSPSGLAALLGSRQAARLFWIVAALLAIVWFATLATRHLLPSDEGRYAEIAREMFASGDWVTIRYNGVKYFEKPPFHLWMTALAFEVFGVGDWQARLWVGLSGALGLAATVLAARRVFGDRVALLTGLVLVATPAWFIASHFNSLDVGVASALACATAALLVAQRAGTSAREERGWMWLAWIAMGVAVLSKGLIGIVLPGAAVLAYAVVGRDWAIFRRLHIVSGTIAMLAVVAPWFILISLRNPEFARFFFIHEHWERYTSTVHHRGGAWWYFVPQLILGFLPWLVLVPRMVRVVAADRHRPGFKPALFLAVWIVVIFVFFSASHSKLPGYIIPLYPPLALLAGLALADMDGASFRWQVAALLALTTIGLLASPYVAGLGSDPSALASYRSFAVWLAAGCALATAGLVGTWLLNRRDATRAIAAYALSVFVLLSVVLSGHESFGRVSSGVGLVAPLEAVLEPGMPIYSVRLLDHTLPFYLRRTTVMVESPDELEFGVGQEPAKWLPTLDAFVREWRSPRKAAAVMTHETFDELRRQGVAMTTVAENPRRVVVVNFETRQP